MLPGRHIARCAALFVCAAAVNFVSEKLCLKYIGDGEITLIRGVLGLRNVQNPGAAFGLFGSNAALASALGAVVIALMLSFLLFGKMNLISRLFFTLALTGGACNLYSRIVYGYVNDWVELRFMDFPLFNFADACVVVGGILFAVSYLFAKDKGSNEA